MLQAAGQQAGARRGVRQADRLWEPVYLSADAQEGPAAFRAKRPPVWLLAADAHADPHQQVADAVRSSGAARRSAATRSAISPVQSHGAESPRRPPPGAI